MLQLRAHTAFFSSGVPSATAATNGCRQIIAPELPDILQRYGASSVVFP